MKTSRVKTKVVWVQTQWGRFRDGLAKVRNSKGYARVTAPLRKRRTKVQKLWIAYAVLLGLVWFYFSSVQHNAFNLYGAMPTIDKIQNPKIDRASDLYTADGKLIGRYYKENRNPVGFNEISPNVINALIATEDVRFYQHSGIDFKGLLSAAWDALRGDARGASTISQQLAKNLHKTRQKGSGGALAAVPGLSTLVIKTKEWLAAIDIEQVYTKEEILTSYLNTVEFGSNAFGINTAAKTFFNTAPDSLSVQQAALLVGVLKAPTYYSPVLNPDNALRRRNVVLSLLAGQGYLTAAEKDSLSKLPLGLNYHPEANQDGPDDYYRTAMNSFLNKWCEENGYDLYADGLKIYTTIDSRFQEKAETAVQEQMRDMQRRFDQHWKGRNPWVDENDKEIPGFIEMVAKRTSLYKRLQQRFKQHPDSINIVLNTPRKMQIFTYDGVKEVEMSPLDSIRHHKRFLHTGLLSMDPYTGYIKAWVGGVDYKSFKYDHVKQGKRQAGSAFKPFVYLTALERGYAPCDQIRDYRVTINYVENGEAKSWTPRNADYVYSGRDMTLRHALGRSINTVTAQLTEKVGPSNVVKYAKRLGITSPLKPVPSVGLGSNDVSIYEMVGAFGTFVNEGVWTEPIFVLRIEDSKGNIVHQFTPRHKRVLNPETAWLMLYMMRGPIEEPGGTAQNLWSFDVFKNGNEFAAKTGTTSNHSDGWFMAINKDLVTGVWVGGDDRSIHFRTSALGEGSKTALPIFGRYMEKVLADPSLGIKPGPFPKPSVKIKRKYYCPTNWRPVRDNVPTVNDLQLNTEELYETLDDVLNF